MLMKHERAEIIALRSAMHRAEENMAYQEYHEYERELNEYLRKVNTRPPPCVTLTGKVCIHKHRVSEDGDVVVLVSGNYLLPSVCFKGRLYNLDGVLEETFIHPQDEHWFAASKAVEVLLKMGLAGCICIAKNRICGPYFEFQKADALA